MRSLALFVPICVLMLAGCARETPVRVENRNLGIVALFPGQPRLSKYTELTPFGEMEWFSTTYETPGRLDRSFYIDVGNLPAGDQGGATESQVLATLRAWLTKRLGKPELVDLPVALGPGFRYKVKAPSGAYAEGIAILKRGRIHRAQATVSGPEDPAVKAFLDSFEVLP